MADKMTVKQALKAIQTEVNYHAGSDTHYRAEKLEQSLATLRAEIKRLEKDAGRYRWLRKGAHDDIAVVRGLGAMDYGMGAIVPTYSKEINGDDLDAAIDADRAMYEGHDGSRKKILYSAAPPPSVPEQKKLRVGNLATMTDGEYPGLGDWWVQLWDGDEVFARAFGTSPEEARRRAEHIRDALAQQPAAQSTPVGVEGPLSLLRAGHWREVYIGHRCMRLEVTYDYATWERLMAEVESALAQQPAAIGEEIMVNAAHDVFILPLQPSGLSSGPRFVVHVPAPEPAGEPCRTINIDDIVAWADGVQGALGTEHANRVTEREAAASRAVMAAIASAPNRCPHGARRPHECKECADAVPASEALEWAEREFAAARQSPGEPVPVETTAEESLMTEQPEAQAGGAVAIPADSVDGELSVEQAINELCEMHPGADRLAMKLLAALFTHKSVIRYRADTTTPAQVPEGYVLVPVEPTDHMGKIGGIWARNSSGHYVTERDVCKAMNIYRAMLAAAPAPKEGEAP